MVKKKTHVNLTIDNDLIVLIDDRRELVSRSAFINDELRKRLKRKK